MLTSSAAVVQSFEEKKAVIDTAVKFLVRSLKSKFEASGRGKEKGEVSEPEVDGDEDFLVVEDVNIVGIALHFYTNFWRFFWIFISILSDFSILYPEKDILAVIFANPIRRRTFSAKSTRTFSAPIDHFWIVAV